MAASETAQGMSLLFVDALGVKQRWRRGGIAQVARAYECLEELASDAIETVGIPPEAGGIESDAVALVFATPAAALRVGRAMFVGALDRAAENPDERLWIRGVISPVAPDSPLVADSVFRPELPQVEVRRYSGDLLRAINIEQSGTKGVRLLIDRSLVDERLTDEVAIKVGKLRHVIPVRTLNHSLYPQLTEAAPTELADVLWMLPDPITHFDDWIHRERQLLRLLRESGQNPEEFAHLAATALAFQEAAAILGSVGVRRDGGLPGSPGNKY